VWTVNGIPGRGEQPATAGNFSGRLLIIGCADTKDADVANAAGKYDDVMALNEAGMFHAGTHWASLHPEIMWPGLLHWRQVCLSATHVHLHAQSNNSGGGPVGSAWQIPNPGGTTGMWSCLVGLALGYSEIVLAGCPLEGGYFFGGDLYCPHGDDQVQPTVWAQAEREWFHGRVKSMSGRTREWLGAP
jgi:hypothetical protein